MPWLLLLLGVLSSGATGIALRPIHRPAAVAGLSFAVGWLTSELPLHHIAWQAMAALALALAGGLSTLPAQAGLLLLVLSWTLLVHSFRRAGDAGAVIETALRDGLGPDYRSHVAESLRSHLSSTVAWGPLVVPFRIRHSQVERERDVVYHQAGRLRLRLDVYRHRSRPRGCPTLLYVHGGAWMIGNKDHQGLPMMQHLAARGWVCFSINYRLSPRATFPDQLVDVKRAIAWVRSHGAEYGADPGFIVVAGGSAGGHLAALAALTPNDPEYQPGFEAADTRLQGCIAIYGIYDFADRHEVRRHQGLDRILERHVMKTTVDAAREAYEKASPIARLRPDAPPFLVVHGELDTLVPVDEARRFVAALGRVSRAAVVYAEIPGAHHAFEVFPSRRTAHLLNGQAHFAAWVYSRYLETRPREAAAREVTGG